MANKKYSDLRNEILENRKKQEEIYAQRLAQNYSADKRPFYASEKNAKKDIEFEANYFESNYDERHRKATDFDSLTERRRNVLNNKIEKKAIETFKSFTPEEVEVKIDNAKYFANNTKDFNRLKDYEKKYKNGELEKKIKKDIYTKDGANLEDRRMKNFFDNFEIIEIERQNKRGFGAITVGNKKTGKVDMFFFGTNAQKETKEEKEIYEKETQGNADTLFMTSVNSKAALEYAKKIQEKAKKGMKGSNGKTYTFLDSITGHSKGGYEAIYVGSNIPNVRVLASDPGPLTETGKYLNKNKILAVLPNEGNASFNYAQKVPGSKGNKLSSITVLSVRTENLGLPKTDFHYAHYPNALSAGEEMRKMQNYAKKVEPKLNAFLEKQKKEKQEKIVNTIKAIAKQADKITPFKTNFEKMAANIPKELAHFRPKVSTAWKNTVNEIKKQVTQNSIGKFVNSIIKPKQNLIDKGNEIKLKPDINFQNKILEFAKRTNLSLSNKLTAPVKGETFKPKIATKQESGKSKAGTLISKGIEIPQKNKNLEKQEKTGQMVADNKENKKIVSEKMQLKNQSKTASKTLQEKVANYVFKKTNSSKEKAVSKNKKR